MSKGGARLPLERVFKHQQSFVVSCGTIKGMATKPKKPSPLSEAASAMGKKGGARTLALHGPEHFSKASKARKTFGGGCRRVGHASRRAGRKPEERNDLQTRRA